MKFKTYLSGFTVMSMLAIIVALSATHGAVGVASCDYCQTKEIVSIQSDSLDKVAVAEKAKADMVIADNVIFINKIKTDKVIIQSFVESTEKMKTYAKVTDNKESTAEDIAAAELDFSYSLLKRFDQTKRNYELASNSLINDGSASMGSGKAGKHKQSITWQACNTASEATAESDKWVCGSCPRSAGTTITT